MATCTMLIVEDEETSREILSFMFRKKYDVIEAYNGKDALEIVNNLKNKIDIVLLDLVMEPMDGYDVLRKRMEEPEYDFFQEIPVVVMTGQTSTESQIEALKLGANDFISKPFIPEIIYRRIENVMISRDRMLSIMINSETMKLKLQLDEMTGVYNKTTIEEMVEEKLQNNRGKNQNALMIFDIDNFKRVNDLSGHLAGDNTIKIVANLLSSFFRKSDYVGRIGGDEFLVFMRDIPSIEIAREKVEQVVSMLKYEPNLTIPENVSVSAGFATDNGCPCSYEELFNKADQALYHAKKMGKARAEEYGRLSEESHNDKKSVTILLSRDRAIYTLIKAIAPSQMSVIHAHVTDEFEKLREQYQSKLTTVIIDISDEEDLTIRNFFEAYDFNPISNVLAICREGRMPQYKVAIDAGATDIVTVPLEEKNFKRRMATCV